MKRPIIAARLGPPFRLHGLWKVFPGRRGSPPVPVFSGVDLVAPSVAILGIRGPSGGGKSTLLHLLGGLDLDCEGLLEVLGRPVPRQPGPRLDLFRRRVAFVLQGADLQPHEDALENAALPLLFRGVPRAEALGGAAHWLAELGLAERLRTKAAALSGGERQRVSIARALASGARLILADEPTSALDPEHRAEVLLALERAARVHRRRVVLVSHDPEALAIAGAVLHCEPGRLTLAAVPTRSAEP